MERKPYREARHAANVSPEEAAWSLGVSLSTLYAWERGERNPDAPHMQVMSRLYRCSCDDLMGTDSKPMAPA